MLRQYLLCYDGSMRHICTYRLFVLLSIVWPVTSQTLRNVQVLFRHGDRTPHNGFPTNPYGPEDWPNGYNQLTQEGMRQTRNLGQFLRARYDGFLNRTYVKDEVYARSTDKDRTLMSAAAVLAGLYPPQGFQQWDTDINWQPIPVHTVPLEDDNVLRVDNDCPRYSHLLQQALTSPQAQQLIQDNKELISYVAENTGWGADITLQNMFDIFDPLYCMVLRGKSLPGWVTEDVYQRLRDHFFYREPDFWYYYEEQVYLKAGMFMKLMTDTLTDPGTERMLLYGSHDSTISGVMFALDVWNGIVPPYVAALIVELHQSTVGQEDVVRLFYKNDTVTDPSAEPLAWTLPGCSMDCPLSQFTALVRRVTYEGSNEDLKNDCADNQIPGDIVAVSVIALGVVFIFLATVCYVICCRKQTPSLHAPYDKIPHNGGNTADYATIART